MSSVVDEDEIVPDVDDDEFSDFDFEGRESLTPDMLRRIIASGYAIPDKEPVREPSNNYGVIDDVEVPVMTGEE